MFCTYIHTLLLGFYINGQIVFVFHIFGTLKLYYLTNIGPYSPLSAIGILSYMELTIMVLMIRYKSRRGADTGEEETATSSQVR